MSGDERLYYDFNDVGNWVCPVQGCNSTDELTREDSVYRHVVWHHPEYIRVNRNVARRGITLEQLRTGDQVEQGICIICGGKKTDKDVLFRHYRTHNKKELVFDIDLRKRPLIPRLRRNGILIRSVRTILNQLAARGLFEEDLGQIYYPEEEVRDHFNIHEGKATDGAFHYLDCPYVFMEDKGDDIISAMDQLKRMITLAKQKSHFVPFAVIVTNNYDRWLRKFFPRSKMWVLDVKRIKGVNDWPHRDVKIFLTQKNERVDDLFRRMAKIGITQWP